MEEIIESQISGRATVLRPATVYWYRRSIRLFLNYLHTAHPEVTRFSQLRRDPHIIGYMRSLYERQPRLANPTRMGLIIAVRRLLNDLVAGGRGEPRDDLFNRGDCPPHDKYLPRPLSPEDDEKLMEQLRRQKTMRCYALRLLRGTGIRIGECLNLAADSLREVGPGYWAIRVPLGKLHTERWVPIDQETREVFRLLQSLRSQPARAASETVSQHLLLQKNGKPPSYRSMHNTLAKMARQAGCSICPTPHQLRHTYATAMLRAGASLPVVKNLLGHRGIEMTLRYVQVSQVDLQREYHKAIQRMREAHAIPSLPAAPVQPGTSGLREILDELIHRMEMLRRHLDDERAERTLQRLAYRLHKIREKLKSFDHPAK
jgi:site-specific recombinase XerD